MHVHEPQAATPSNVATVGLTLVTTAIVTVTGLTVPFLRRFSGAPYVASTTQSRNAIKAALRTHSSAKKSSAESGIRQPRIVDLGSGSGEIVLDAARMGYDAIGYELNIWLILLSRLRAYRQGTPNARFIRKDFWHASLHDCDAVVVFGVPRIMSRLGEKLRRECATGCLVCSNTFEIGGWHAFHQHSGVWFYSVRRSDRE